MYAARRTGMKKELFGFVRGGYARVVERLGSLLAGEAVDVRLECGVRRIDSHAGGDVAAVSEEGREETFDRVVLTVPAPAAARMCPELSDEERRLFGAIPYQGIVCASLLLERPLADFYVTNVTDPAAPFTGVIEMTALVDPAHFGGRSLAYLPKYAAPDDAVFELSDEEIEARFVAGLEAMYPAFRREQVLAFRVSRVRQVMAIPTLNYSRSLPPMRTSVPGLFIVNSSQIVSGTLNVNEVVRLAETSVGRLLAFGGEDPAGASAEGEDYGEADRQLVAGS
jgi:protoporphyrinogen oxidase